MFGKSKLNAKLKVIVLKWEVLMLTAKV